MWVAAKGREKHYLVSNLGRLYSIHRNKILALFINRKGYVGVKAKNNDGSISSTVMHRVVAITFIPNPENKKEVNHINGIKTDNRVVNLEWATCQENIKAAYDTNLKSNKGEKHPKSIFTNKQVNGIRLKHKNGIPTKRIAELYNAKYCTIWKIIKGINFK